MFTFEEVSQIQPGEFTMHKYFSTALKLITSLLIVFLLASCWGMEPPAPPPVAQQSFVPLPPPEGNWDTSYNFIGFGKRTQLQRLISSTFSDEYSENGSGVGKITSEKMTLLQTNVSGVTKRITWGDWAGGVITKSVYYDNLGKIAGGMIELELKSSPLIPIALGEPAYALDKSVLSLVYSRTDPNASWPTLIEAKYQEYGGVGADRLAMGASVTWHDVSQLSEYQQWAFWENGDNPFNMVTKALDKAKSVYATAVPDLVAFDQDSIAELVGRQSGMRLYENGVDIGYISVEYNSLFGPQPNSDGLLGAASLSRVNWKIKDENYCALVISPKFDRQRTTLYIFLDDPALADTYLAMPYPKLYPILRQNPEGVLLAVYAIGYLSEENSQGTGSVSTSDGDKPVSVNVSLGTKGGLDWVVLGDPSYDDILKAHNLVNLGGEGFVKSIGWGFPYAPGSGSGLNFYVSLLRIVSSPAPLTAFGQDVGIINRVGFGELPTP